MCFSSPPAGHVHPLNATPPCPGPPAAEHLGGTGGPHPPWSSSPAGGQGQQWAHVNELCHGDHIKPANDTAVTRILAVERTVSLCAPESAGRQPVVSDQCCPCINALHQVVHRLCGSTLPGCSTLPTWHATNVSDSCVSGASCMLRMKPSTPTRSLQEQRHQLLHHMLCASCSPEWPHHNRT
jgi:hypothetical protein